MARLRAVASVVLACAVACGAANEEAPSGTAPAPSPAGDAGDAGDAGAPDAAVTDAGAVATDAAPGAPVVTSVVLTTSHRAVPGKMFGGWGPHLGHLVRRPGGELWFVDDACDASTPCDVDKNGRLDAFRLGAAGWERRAQIALPTGVQQNTGTIAAGDAFESYGVDVLASRIVRCRLEPAAPGSASCAQVPVALPPSTNYVGAAVSPDGWKVAWATTVKDGGGGTFHWLVDYGGGWNGPRTGGIGGYNDASYVNVAFGGGAQKTRMLTFAQLVSGLAPNWTFRGAVGDVDTATSDAVTFALLAPSGNDPIASTNDVVVDPASNDAHLVARSEAGAAVLYFRPSGGTFGAPVAAIPGAYRARFVPLADGRLVLVYGKNGVGLFVRVAPAGRPAGAAVAWGALPEIPIALPAGYASLYAIYPESPSTQRVLPTTLDVALVGSVRENEVLHVHVEL